MLNRDFFMFGISRALKSVAEYGEFIFFKKGSKFKWNISLNIWKLEIFFFIEILFQHQFIEDLRYGRS